MALQSLLGILIFILFAWFLSENRKIFHWKTVVTGVLLQFGLAITLLKLPFFKTLFLKLNTVVIVLGDATQAGTAFVFGYLGGATLPFATNQNSTFILAFKALPIILVMSALSALLFHWRILPVIVNFFSWLLRRTMQIGGAMGLGVAVNIFVGMVEAPLLIRPYIKKMTHSELFTLMATGMATIAGTVMAFYASILSTVMDDALGQLLIASIISAPAAILISRVMVPETEPQTEGSTMIPSGDYRSSMDAITHGTADGLKLLVHIVAMLIVLVALVALANQILGLAPNIGGEAITLQRILGFIMAPIAWLMGVPWNEAYVAGSLLGTKIVLNELIAYLNLVALPKGTLSQHSQIIMMYALCGFANLGSLGIMIGGLGTMVPERRSEVVALGVKSIVAGTLATCMTGAVVGIIL